KGTELYGRLARSDEHSPGVAVSGGEPGDPLQVRQRAEDSGLQVGQPLALQEVEAGSVDGREVEPDGSADQEETEGGHEGRRVTVGKNSRRDAGATKGGHMFGFGAKSIVGLDVGSSSIRAVELKGRGGEIEVAPRGLEPLAPDIVVDSMIVDSGTVS